MKQKMIIAVMVLVVLSGCTTTGTLTFLPTDIHVIKPDPGIGKVGEFSGIWSGNWDNASSQATAVVLEKIDPAEVIAVYAWGPTSSYPGDSIRVSGKIENASTIVLEWGNVKRRVTLTRVGDKIHAEYRRAGQVNHAVLTKVPTPAPTQ